MSSLLNQENTSGFMGKVKDLFIPYRPLKFHITFFFIFVFKKKKKLHKM